MSRRRKNPWQQEIDWASAIVAPLGCTVEISTHQFEIATVKGDGVSLLIYPHKTSASNFHARIRDNGSKDRARADRVMLALDQGEGLPEDIRWRVRFTCTFSVKNNTHTEAGRKFQKMIRGPL